MTKRWKERSRNIIDAIISLCDLKDLSVKADGESKNRINGMGAPFEAFGKKLFAGAFDKTPAECLALIVKEFSYLGEQNNPPDAMIRGGDAIEFKKLESFKAGSLQLNSSFPKHSLESNSSLITQKCRDAEQWEEKDIIYSVGVVKGGSLNRMWMVYGSDYCDVPDEYLKLRNSVESAVRNKIKSLGYGMDEDSTEPARVNKNVDHFDVTRFRLRAIWEIQSPWMVFEQQYKETLYVHEQHFGHRDFEFVALINNDKWDTFDNTNMLSEMIGKIDGLGIYNVMLKKPDMPAETRQAKMVIYTR